MKPLLVCLILVAGVVLVYISCVHLTHSSIHTSAYTLGVDTPGDLRQVTLLLTPQGTAEYGVGGTATYKDPTWPLPTSIRISFQDTNKTQFAAEISSALPKGFSGELTVHVEKDTNGYGAFLLSKTSSGNEQRTPTVIVSKQN